MKATKHGPALLSWDQWEQVTAWVMQNRPFIEQAKRQDEIVTLALKRPDDGGCACRSANLYSFLEIIRVKNIIPGWVRASTEQVQHQSA